MSIRAYRPDRTPSLPRPALYLPERSWPLAFPPEHACLHAWRTALLGPTRGVGSRSAPRQRRTMPEAPLPSCTRPLACQLLQRGEPRAHPRQRTPQARGSQRAQRLVRGCIRVHHTPQGQFALRPYRSHTHLSMEATLMPDFRSNQAVTGRSLYAECADAYAESRVSRRANSAVARSTASSIASCIPVAWASRKASSPRDSRAPCRSVEYSACSVRGTGALRESRCALAAPSKLLATFELPKACSTRAAISTQRTVVADASIISRQISSVARAYAVAWVK